MKRLLSVLAVAIVVAAAAACADAGGEAKGGDITPGGQQAVTPAPFVGSSYDAGTDCGSGTTWSSLYADIFGPTGRPGSCSFLSECHGNPGSDRAHAAGPTCFEQHACRQSMIDQNLIASYNKNSPLNSTLLSTVRRPGNLGGSMPQSPPDYVFPQACVDRMVGWIANGFPDD